MKRRIKPGRQMARFMIILLMTIVAWCFVPQMGAPGHAASGNPAMELGTDVLNQNVNSSNAQTVWYAGKTWRVIGYNGDGVVSENGAVTLLAAGNLKQSVFDRNSNSYSGSTLEGNVNGILNDFAPGEQGAIKTRTLVHGQYVGINTDCIQGNEDLNDIRLWPLSTKEANTVNKDLRIVDPDNPTATANHWWLRSPGDHYTFVALVYADGRVKHDGGHMGGAAIGVRPAFYLNLESVLFTSASRDGKLSGAAGADALKPVGETSSNQWKLTLLDDGTANPFLKGHSGFDVSEIVRTENGVSVRYTGAKTGPNEYISAIITDRPFTDSSARITYYGRIKNCVSGDDADGTETINTAGKLRAGDILYIFNEQYNYQEGLYGDKTDYVSKLVEVHIPPVTYTVTFVDGQGNTLKTETVESGNSATAPDDPKREGYTFKGWDKDFSHVTENITVTALWEKNITPTPTPTPDNKAGCILLAKMTAKGSRKLVISWNPIDGAAGYDVFLVKCGKNNMGRPVRTIKGETSLTWTKKSLRKKTPYKAVVKAWTIKDGKKVFVVTSPIVHAYTSGGTRKYTNARSVAVNKTRVSLAIGKTFTVRARVNKIRKGKKLMMKNHAPKLRYLSSNTKIATVNESGIITARAKGSCIIYVIAVNGSRKAITVMVE